MLKLNSGGKQDPYEVEVYRNNFEHSSGCQWMLISFKFDKKKFMHKNDRDAKQKSTRGIKIGELIMQVMTNHYHFSMYTTFILSY